jgi:hypothetical protein
VRVLRQIRALLIGIALAGVYTLARPQTAAATTHVSQDGWDLYFESTTGDGTKFTLGYFNGTKVFDWITLPSVFVTYSETPNCCVDDLGYSQPLKIGPAKTNITGGFQVMATYCFGTCNPPDATDNFTYKYREEYTFLNTGEWTAKLSIFGPGLYPNATYEAFWRVDYDIVSTGADHFQRYSGGSWSSVVTEQEYADDGANAPGGYEWRQYDGSHTYEIDPLSATGWYQDLVVVWQSGEIGAPPGVRSYPAALYDNNESVDGADLVQWYHGVRVYSRPTGCTDHGVGCTTSVPITFRAIAIAY